MFIRSSVDVHLGLRPCFLSFLGYICRDEIAGSYEHSLFGFSEESLNYSPPWLYRFPSPPGLPGAPISPQALTTLVTLILKDSHPNGCEEVSPHGFDFHFPDD